MIKLMTLFLFVFSLSLQAKETSYHQHEQNTLVEIEVLGLVRTKKEIVLNELDVKVGKKLTEVELKESYARLFNLRIFSEIDFELRQIESEKSKLQITVKERWTLIPIAKIQGGGGTTQFTLGAFDINVFGKYIELGAQYENLNGSSGFVHWFRNPRLMGHRLRLGYDIWNVTRNRLLYTNSVPAGEAAETIAGYTVNTEKYNVFLDREFLRWFNLGVSLDLTKRSTSTEGLSDEIKGKNSSNGFVVPESLQEFSYSLYFRLGRLNYVNYLVEGFESNLKLQGLQEKNGADESAYRFTATSKYFFLLPYEQNLGFGFNFGDTDSESFQNNFFVGGLSNVRSFQDGQFIGTSFWQLNAEYRVSSFRTRRFVLQHNVFYDVGNVSGKLDELFSGNPRDPFQSVGAGVRIISPAIYRFNVRIDVAKGLNYNKPWDVSFGLQQFF